MHYTHALGLLSTLKHSLEHAGQGACDGEKKDTGKKR